MVYFLPATKVLPFATIRFAPARLAVPLMLVVLALALLMEIRYAAAEAKTRLPVTLRVPTVPGRPGIKVPPLAMLTAPTVPVPSKVPPEFTLIKEFEIVPVALSPPAFTLVGPE